MENELNRYLDISPEVQAAIAENKPVVVLESTILSHGMPYPENVGFAAEVEKVVRAEGAIPATAALIHGRIKVGLTPAELDIMCKAENVGKVSRRDMATYLATGQNGATTVATTMICANMAGLKVFATGGIGGVHRHGETTMDVSADLQELKQTSVAVVCAGAKQILDIGRTLEYLETMGVPVIGNGTKDFPAFYCRKSGFGVDYAAKDEQEIAKIIKTKWDLGLTGGVLIGNPIPEEYALDFDYMEGIINRALAEAEEKGVRGKDITPFLLAKVKELTKGVSFASNVQLAYNNARAAAKISKALCELN
jgi:pseudouridine-5'-phosphate glycosidase